MTTVQAILVGLISLACIVNGTRTVVLYRQGHAGWRASLWLTLLFVVALLVNVWVLQARG